MSLIKPEWRSGNVVGMCMSIRETQDYSALPILADALQDADCDDESLLDLLRGERGSELASQRLVALIMSQETADAVAWMHDFAEKELGTSVDDDGGTQVMDYAVLMGAASRHLSDDYYFLTQWGTDSWRDVMYARTEAFWEHYQLITGKIVTNKDDNFIRCSC